LLAERGITVDHVTVYRWVLRFTPEFIEAARPGRHVPGNRWFVDETYLKVAGKWTYLYRAVDQHGQVIDVLVSAKRDLAAARRFFGRALRIGTIPAEVTTDRAAAYPRVVDELIPSALHTVEQYANNAIEADHGRLKARLRPMRGLKRHRSARILAAGHAFVQNLRRGHCDIAAEVPDLHRLRIAFDDLATTISPAEDSGDHALTLSGWRNATVPQAPHRAALSAALAPAPAPHGFTVAEFTATIRRLSGQAGYTIRQGGYDLRKLRSKGLAVKPGRTRRYHIPPDAARTIAALLALRDQVIAPILAGPQSSHRPQARAQDPHRPRLRDPSHRHADSLPRPRDHLSRSSRIDNIFVDRRNASS